MNTTKLLLGTRTFSSNMGLAARLAAARAMPQKQNLQCARVMASSQKRATPFMPSVSMRHFGVETIKVPALGDSISEGVIEEFMKKPGDFVAQDDVIARIETDKVTVDIAAPRAGVIKEYFAEEGDTVEVNADFYSLDTDGKPDPNAGAAAPKKAEPAPAAPASTPAPPKAEAATPAPKAAAAPAQPAAPAAPQQGGTVQKPA